MSDGSLRRGGDKRRRRGTAADRKQPAAADMVRPRRGCRERRSRDDGRARAAAGVSVRVDVRASDVVDVVALP